VAAGGVIVGRDACVRVRPWPRERAQPALAALMQAWREGHFGRDAPLPLAPRTAWALVQGVADVAAVYEGSTFAGGRRGEVDEACLARVFPDHAALCADGRFATLAQELFAPMAAWIASDVRVEPLVATAAAEPGSDRD
jgi:exodeoxyribonuclease V gamma subunit